MSSLFTRAIAALRTIKSQLHFGTPNEKTRGRPNWAAAIQELEAVLGEADAGDPAQLLYEVVRLSYTNELAIIDGILAGNPKPSSIPNLEWKKERIADLRDRLDRYWLLVERGNHGDLRTILDVGRGSGRR